MKSLTVELVPASSWYNNVRSKVSTKEWDVIRKSVYKKAGNKCEICNSPGRLECHEIWDYNDETNVQTLINMEALCNSCHLVRHIGRASITGKLDKAIKHLCKINNWSKSDAELYVESVFETWARRSKKEWVVDIEMLKGWKI